MFLSFLGVGHVINWFKILTSGMKIHVKAADGYIFGKSPTGGSEARITAEKVTNHG